jgi:hypothetical protein
VAERSAQREREPDEHQEIGGGDDDGRSGVPDGVEDTDELADGRDERDAESLRDERTRSLVGGDCVELAFSSEAMTAARLRIRS